MNACRIDPDGQGTIAPRRGFLRRGLWAVVGGLFARPATAAQPAPADSELTMAGPVLQARVSRGRPPIEPLDTVVRWERSDRSEGRAVTHQVLSLIHEEKGTKSYLWTVYAHLTTHHVEGDGCVVCSRLHKNAAGWSCGLHSEVFSDARGVGLGVNVEMWNSHAGDGATQIIGVNVQANGPRDCQYGVQIHDGKGRFEKGIGLNGTGQVGLDAAGTYGVGVHLHGNSLRVDEGTAIELEGTGRIRMRYRKGRIEFLNGDRCVGHIDTKGEDHAL